MKRRIQYLVAAFYLVAALSWAHDAARLLWAFVQGDTVTLDRADAMALGVGSLFLTGVLAWATIEAWRRARPRKPVGKVEVLLRVDTSAFNRQIAALQRATARAARERGLATTPAIVTGIALLAVVLAVIDRSWLDALAFATFAGFAAAWTYLDTATEGRRS